MLLTITTNQKPATNLGYLLHKNPSRCQTSETAFGNVHVFYPQATEDVCTAAMLVEIDPIGMIRRRKHGRGGLPLEQYVNDRPYVASSFLSVAISQVFGAALRGQCLNRPELIDNEFPLEIGIDVVSCHEGNDFIRRLFEPLGYEVRMERLLLDEKFLEWGESQYYSIHLQRTVQLAEALKHLYVLLPVLDNQKHYFISDEEIDKLMKHGKGWLASHPEHELITRRYLKYQTSLAHEALIRLTDENPEAAVSQSWKVIDENEIEEAVSLHEQRLQTAKGVLRSEECRRILDLGCGEGKLLKLLLEDRFFTEMLGVDVSVRALEIASKRLHLDRLPPIQKERIRLVQGSLMYRDKRLEGYDAAAILEVIEHLDPPRLIAFERVVFEFAKPRVVVITTPNAEYNTVWASLPAGKFRHSDHRFEWSREQFQVWSQNIASNFNYTVRYLTIGEVDAEKGSPTQMAVFTRQEVVRSAM